MKLLQILAVKLMSLAVLLLGALAVYYRFGNARPHLHRVLGLVDSNSGFLGTLLLILLGLCAVLAGLLGVLPQFKRRKGQLITFHGAHGDVTIELDSVENSLNRAIAKMPEVKNIDLEVTPTPNGSSVQITGEVTLFKELGVGALSTANYVRETIKMTAQNVLGVNEVNSVAINVRGIIVDPKKKKQRTEPEFLTKPKDPASTMLPGSQALPSRSFNQAQQQEPRPHALNVDSTDDSAHEDEADGTASNQ